MSSTSMPTRALFSSPGKASLTDDDDDDEEVKKVEMTTDDDDDDDYDDICFYANSKLRLKSPRRDTSERRKRCSVKSPKISATNSGTTRAFFELFLSATFTALCELSCA